MLDDFEKMKRHLRWMSIAMGITIGLLVASLILTIIGGK